MNIRWRLGVLTSQIIVLAYFSYLINSKFYTNDTWFLAGLLSVVINPQLMEPFYTKIPDVVGNCIVTFFIFLTTPKFFTQTGWIYFVLFLLIGFLLSIIKIIIGINQKNLTLSNLSNSISEITKQYSSLRIYSVVLFLAALEKYPNLDKSFWIIILAWLITVSIGLINWQKFFGLLSNKKYLCFIEGMTEPSRLFITSNLLPESGRNVRLTYNGRTSKGTLLTRINRKEDVWGEIVLESEDDCAEIVRCTEIELSVERKSKTTVVGTVDEGSDDGTLVFHSIFPLEIGDVVSIVNQSNYNIYYQINNAKVTQFDIKNGSRLNIRVSANQLGVFSENDSRFRRHRWAPMPGLIIHKDKSGEVVIKGKIPKSWFLIGTVLGTNIPVYLDLDILTESHLAILGMTKMSKTTLSCKIADALSKRNNVVILDQTGEYISKRKMNRFSNNYDDNSSCVSVIEPNDLDDLTKVVLQHLEKITKVAKDEYLAQGKSKRIMIIDEAHQFIPEPSGMDFKSQSRENSIKFGLYMMQVRKYGISIIIISQRTAVVAKNALSQCENIIAFKNLDHTGLDYLESVLGIDAKGVLPRLNQGEAMVFGPAFSTDSPIIIKTNV